MITFDLQCSNGHQFEGWFEDRHSFDLQKNKKLVLCPHCNSNKITKLISKFAIKRNSSNNINNNKIALKLKNYVNKNFDDVGTDFAKEALKMHYGVVKARNIRGVSSPEEDKLMNSEGIHFFKLPLSLKTPDQEQNN